MALLRLIVVMLLPLFALASGAVFTFLTPAHAARAALLAVPAVAIGWGFILGRTVLRHLKGWSFVVLPTVFVTGVNVTLLLFESNLARILLTILSGALVGAYTWFLLLHFYYPSSYRPYTLAATSQVLSLFAAFFLGFDMTALANYLAFPPWRTGLGVFLISAAAIAGTLISYRIAARRSLGPVLVSSLLLAELFGVTSLLPLAPGTSGALFALSTYACAGIIRLTLEGSLLRTAVYRYAAITGAGTVLVLGTARWG